MPQLLRLFLCALAQEGFSDDDKRPIIMLSASHLSELMNVADQQLRNDVCEEYQEFPWYSKADQDLCKEAWRQLGGWVVG